MTPEEVAISTVLAVSQEKTRVHALIDALLGDGAAVTPERLREVLHAVVELNI